MADETKPRQPWTPGTWELAGPVGNAGWIQSATNNNIAAVHKIATREGMANGVLMVAAPVLAEALAAVIEPAEDVRNELRAVSAGCDAYVSALDEALAACRAALELCGWRWS